MKNTIWKYELDLAKITRLQVPKGGEVLTVQIDQKSNTPCIWVMLDSENESEERIFELFGTGHPIESGMGVGRKHIGTYQYQKGKFVGHVFEYTGV